MLKAGLAALAIGILLAVLSLLTIESRSVTEAYYISHANNVRAIERSTADVGAVMQAAQEAFEQGVALDESASFIFPRLSDNNRILQEMQLSVRPDSQLALSLPDYDQILSQFVDAGESFAERQQLLAIALQTLQEDSPDVVRDLRELGLTTLSQNTFALAVALIEFATGQNATSVLELQQRIDAIRMDSAIESVAPGRLNEFANVAGEVLTEHVAAQVVLESITGSRIASDLGELAAAVKVENARVVGRADRARLLLSVFAVLLFGGTGFAMLKLQKSYRELNRSNAELATVNNSLEERVASRTKELSAAYDELKESQVQLVQAEKMSSLGELVAGISHEINTPLWYLSSNAAVIQERLAMAKSFFAIGEKMIDAVASRQSVKEEVSAGLIGMRAMLGDGLKDDIDEAEDLVKDSIEGLEELTELAQGLKDFSRLDRAKQGKLDVNEGLDKTLLIAKNRIKNKVTVHKQYGDVPAINCSPSQINQIFLNLITNAADAIEGTGELVLKTWQDAENVHVSIADTGSGIPDDVIARIRDPFFTTKEVGKGTGLGLSIVDQIVTSHGGELKFASVAGRGTTATVSLPIVSIVEESVDADNPIAANSEVYADVAGPVLDGAFGNEAESLAAYST